jgi:tRNA modification GTPase
VAVALLTPPGRGALAVVGVRGRGAVALVDGLFQPRGGTTLVSRGDGAIAFGSWRSTGEDVVVVRHRSDRLEVHCHGGVAAPAAVIASLAACGAMRESWAGGHGGVAWEAHEALARVGGLKAARILCRQAAGALDRECTRIAALRAAGAEAAADAACVRLLAAARVGLRLTRPWRVVLAGGVNAGKSSLVNAIAGHARSIVSEEPGTTRDVVETRLVLDGWEVDLVDVAGERDDAEGPIERAGIARAVAARAEADLVLRVVPGDRPGQPLQDVPAHELLVLSKADMATIEPPAGAMVTSAVTGAGIERLIAAIVARLVPEQRDDPSLLAGAVPFTERQCAELRG